MTTSPTAIIDPAGAYSYDDLDNASMRVAGAMLGTSDDLNEARVAFMVAPGFPYAATQRGIWRAGEWLRLLPYRTRPRNWNT